MTQQDRTTVYLVRHGETLWNLSGQHQGHSDSALSELGVEQARCLGRRLREEGVNFDHMYSSDLNRARETAEILKDETADCPEIDFREGLRERALGLLEGLTLSEIEQNHPDDYRDHMSDDLDYTPEGGESWRDLYERTRAYVRDLCEFHSGETILIVAHAGVLTMVLRDALGIPLDRPRPFTVPNAKLNVLSYGEEGGWLLHRWGA